MTDKIVPCLWYDGTAEEAAAFYVSLLPDSRIVAVHRAPADNPAMGEGGVIGVSFTLAGRDYFGLNGGDAFRFDEAVSFQIMTEGQAETDRLWDAITGHGGTEGNCGWCKDKWGLSWQITPRRLIDLAFGPDPEVARRVFQAMMTMGKIDIAALEAAAAGVTA
jgi:predicted 3-demethylubiquinone-9 3-methyltransferase (glyoxalase superfamily)